jgi:serine protease AprX
MVGKPLRFVLLLGLLMPGMGLLAAPTVQATVHAQPVLLKLAAERPDARLDVIVQKLVKDESVEQQVVTLGGVITKDLHIINAFAAQLPARSIPALAQAAGVRWVSLDAPMSGSSTFAPPAGEATPTPTPPASESVQFTTWATQQGTQISGALPGQFNGVPIRAGSTIWFSGVVSAYNLGSNRAQINVDNANIQFAASGTTYRLPVPDAVVTFDPAVQGATTTFQPITNTWATQARSGIGGSVFVVGMSYRVPVDLPGGLSPVTLSARFTSDTPGIVLVGRWGAAVYNNFDPDYNALGVKACSDAVSCQYSNWDPAGTPENYKSQVIAGGSGYGGTNYVGNYFSTPTGVIPPTLFKNAMAITDSPAGPNGTFGWGNNVTASFSQFVGEKTPGNTITRVEAVLRAYVPAALPSTADVRLTAAVDGSTGQPVVLGSSAFSPYVGAANAGTITVDLTNSRTWRWSDFNSNLRLTIDQSRLSSYNYIYYDAVGLRVTSVRGSDNSGGTGPLGPNRSGPVDTSHMASNFNRTVRATEVWIQGPLYRQGSGVTIAVVDSGVAAIPDLEGRLIGSVNFNHNAHSANDKYGHGTFVAGLAGGDGTASSGAYMGIAPQANILNVRVSDDQGMSAESDVVNGLQWILDNKAQFNIRVVNLSLNSGMMQSYHTSPLDAAAEILWFNNIVVVVSAGNNGSSDLFPPANDPFVITVGATDDHNTVNLNDDRVAPFSAYGVDERGQIKPDLVAPGKDIIGPLPQNGTLTIGTQHGDKRVNENYFRMSGTSLAAPMVSGAVALLLQGEPNLNADQVKYRLKATAVNNTRGWNAYTATKAGAGILDAFAAVNTATSAAANAGLPASHLLWTGDHPPNWGSANWSSVDWASVDWASVDWASVDWASVDWASDYWGP